MVLSIFKSQALTCKIASYSASYAVCSESGTCLIDSSETEAELEDVIVAPPPVVPSTLADIVKVPV